MNSGNDLLAQAQTALSERGYSSVRVLDVKASNQSDLQFLEATSTRGTRSRFVLKVFSDRCEWNSASVVREEFEALEKFSQKLREFKGVDCPVPIKLFEHRSAYLMSYVAGRSLSDLLNEGADLDSRVITNILRGLDLFHEGTREIYGDFHSDNIIVGDEGEVGFVDPTIGDPNYFRFEDPSEDLLGTDLGYWLHTVASRSPKLLFQSPSRARRRIAFATELFRRAVSDLSPTAREEVVTHIFRVARGHLGLMKHSQFRGRVLEPPALLVAKRIMKRVRR